MTFLFLTSTKTPMICAPRLLCRDDDHQEKSRLFYTYIYLPWSKKHTYTNTEIGPHYILCFNTKKKE